MEQRDGEPVGEAAEQRGIDGAALTSVPHRNNMIIDSNLNSSNSSNNNSSNNNSNSGDGAAPASVPQRGPKSWPFEANCMFCIC